jgi:hypothetical protein
MVAPIAMLKALQDDAKPAQLMHVPLEACR